MSAPDFNLPPLSAIVAKVMERFGGSSAFAELYLAIAKAQHDDDSTDAED